MSEDSKRQQTHKIDRTFWRNLRLSFSSNLWTYAKWDNIGLTYYQILTQLVTFITSVTGLLLNQSFIVITSVTTL